MSRLEHLVAYSYASQQLELSRRQWRLIFLHPSRDQTCLSLSNVQERKPVWGRRREVVARNPSWCTCFYEWNWFSLCSEQHCPATSSTSHSINTNSLQPPPCTTIKTAVSETHKHALTLQALLHGRYLLCFSFPIGKAESQHFEYVWTMQAAYSLRDGRGCLSAMAKALFTGSGFLPSILSGERASLVQRTLL